MGVVKLISYLDRLMEKAVADERNAVASLETEQSSTEIAESASESQTSYEIERLSETHGIDSGLANSSSDQSTADSPPVRQSPSHSPEGETSKGVEPNLGAEVSTQRDMGQPPPFTALRHEAEDDNVLAECLEPRPMNEEEAGGTSPKIVQRNLLRKVLRMNTNGSSQSGGDCSASHGQDEEMEEEMEALAISAPEVEDRVAAELIPGTVLQQKRSSVFSVFKR